jgi:SPP1 gp7 family putative phage head morphogenesis protein
MADYGHAETDIMLHRLEKRITKEYSQAAKEMQKKLDTYLEKFKIKDEIKRKKLKAGEITKAEYDYWRTGQIMMGERWKEMVDTLVQDLQNTDKIARSMVKEFSYDAYALNHNYGTFEVEKGSLVDTSYTLYDRSTVERLVRDNPDLLPPPGKKVSEEIRQGKAERWDRRIIDSVMTQSILQGESMPKIAKRLATSVNDSNRKSALRNARTMVTGAENAGRVDSYKRANDMGIDLRQVWIATLDGRTRHSHRILDGERVEIGKTFSNGCRFPGDPWGPAEEVYNCRCTLIALVDGVDIDVSDLSLRNNYKLGGMSYDEWKNEHTVAPAKEFSGIRSKLGDNFVDAMETLLNFTEEEDAKQLFYKWQDDLKVISADNEGGAYYSPREHGVYVNAEKIAQGDNLHRPYQTIFHEFGHNIDHAGGGSGNLYASSYKNGALEKKLKEDWHKFRIRYLVGNPEKWINEDWEMNRILIDMAERDNKRYPEDSKWYDLVRKLRHGEITKDEVFANYAEKLAKGYLMNNSKKWFTDKDIIEMLENENMPLHARGSISDIIGGLMCARGENSFWAYPLGAGHQENYWWKYKITASGEMIKVGSGNLPIEFFAEVLDGKVANPESLKQLRRVFPGSVKLVEQIIQELLK